MSAIKFLAGLIAGCVAILFIMAWLMVNGAGAQAPQQQACGPRANVVAALAAKYAEVPMFTGALESGYTLEFFLNLQTGTWTAMVTRNAVTCIQAVGKDFKLAVPGMEQGL